MIEKNVKKNLYIYIYIKLNQSAIQQKLMQHCKSTINFLTSYLKHGRMSITMLVSHRTTQKGAKLI